MKLDEKKAEIQKKALIAWTENNKKGTIEAITGIGKTFISLYAIVSMGRCSKVLFLAETTEREKDLNDDIEKFNNLNDIDLNNYASIEFMCYQSAYKLENEEYDLVIADEIHDALTPKYSKFFSSNEYGAILGLSATVDRSTSYEENNETYNKGDLVDSIAPVCFKYTIDDGQKDGTSRKLNVYVISHRLDAKSKNVKAGTKLKPFMQTEFAAYNYWDNQFKKALFLPDSQTKKFKITTTSAARAKVLYEAPSKIKEVKKLLKGLKNKTLLFGNSLNALMEVTPNVISSRYSEVKNKSIRENFESGKIKLVGSFKKLKQGANLSGLDNIVIMSYYSKSKDFIQRIGRARKDGNKVGSIFIFLTVATQEQVWFDRMFDGIDSFNIINCSSVEDCIKKYKEEG